VWLTPTAGVPCSNAAKTQNPLKFAWVPQTTEWISAASGPKFTIATAEIRRGKEKETTGQKYNGLPYYLGQR